VALLVPGLDRLDRSPTLILTGLVIAGRVEPASVAGITFYMYLFHLEIKHLLHFRDGTDTSM